MVCPHCHRYPLEDYTWWVSTAHGESSEKWNKAVQLVKARRAANSATGRTLGPSEVKVFGVMLHSRVRA